MSSNSEIQRKLSAGIAAAKQGNRDRARRMLEEVTQLDDRNEQAWLWLATLANTQVERSGHLRKVLTINPNNIRAREALTQLLGVVGSAEERRVRLALGENARIRGDADDQQSPVESLRGAPSRPAVDVGQRQGSGGRGLGILIVIIAVALVGFGLFVILGGTVVPTPIAGLSTQPPGPSQTAAVGFSIVTPSPRPGQDTSSSTDEIVLVLPVATDTPSGPTQTPVSLGQVTRLAPTLPPSITPSITPTQTPTPQVTEAVEIGRFELFYVSQDPSAVEPEVYSLNADGTNDGLILERARDFAFAPDGEQFAFVRDVLISEDGSRLAEVFVGTLADVDNPQQITDLRSSDIGSPSWSPDGEKLVFASGGDLFVIGADGQNLLALTSTPFAEREPAWSPVGDLIVYVADVNGTGFTELFIQRVTESGERLGGPQQATDSGRSSYVPKWSPDGRYVVFGSDRTGDGDIFVMNADGTNEVLLSIGDGGAEDRAPSVSPDGLWIAFTSNRQFDERFQTYVMRFNGTDVNLVTDNPRSDVSVVWRPLDF